MLNIQSIKPEKYLKSWLKCQESLTSMLKHVAGDARLDIISQSWVVPDSWDHKVIKNLNSKVFKRDIVMYANDNPCWFARTVIPDSTYLANHAFFSRLDNESVGQLVFNEARVSRVILQNYAIDTSYVEYSWLETFNPNDESVLWVRFSEFIVHYKYSFYLAEILLPGLKRYSK